MSLSDYINEFDRLNDRIKKCGMEMPDVILVYWLLINANISEEKQQRLARETVGKLAYANMKKQLTAIHGCSFNDFVSDEDAKVTIEASYSDDKEDTRERDVFYSDSCNQLQSWK